MKLLNKSLLLVFLFVSTEFLVGCVVGCVGLPSYPYSHCGLQVRVLDNAGASPEVVSSGSVKKEAFGLRIHIDKEPQVCAEVAPFSLFPKSYAVYKECNDTFYYDPIERIVGIKITADQDINEAFPAGSDITSLFYVFDGSRYASFRTELFEESRIADELIDFSRDALLMTAPEAGGTFMFTVTMDLEDERSFEVTTPSIILE